MSFPSCLTLDFSLATLFQLLAVYSIARNIARHSQRISKSIVRTPASIFQSHEALHLRLTRPASARLVRRSFSTYERVPVSPLKCLPADEIDFIFQSQSVSGRFSSSPTPTNSISCSLQPKPLLQLCCKRLPTTAEINPRCLFFPLFSPFQKSFPFSISFWLFFFALWIPLVRITFHHQRCEVPLLPLLQHPLPLTVRYELLLLEIQLAPIRHREAPR